MKQNEKPNKDKSVNNGLGVFSAVAIAFVLAVYAIILVILIFSWSNGLFGEFWNSLGGGGKATVISALITALGLVTSAVILPFVFKDQVRTLNEMVQNTEKKLSALSETTTTKLTSLSTSFDDQLKYNETQAEQRSAEGQELLKSLHSAVNTLLGQGQVSDSAHAKQIVTALWTKAKFVCEKRLDDKPRMHNATKDQIRTMSKRGNDYLDALEENEIITAGEKKTLLELRRLHFSHAAPPPAEFPTVKNLQETITELANSIDEG